LRENSGAGAILGGAGAILSAVSTGRVLVVEDDQRVRESLLRVLRYEGYEVQSAVDGHAGLAQATSWGPDVVLLDVNLPGLDGLAVARRLRQSGGRVPILCLTARHEIADRVAGLDAGADDYLVKPFELDELLARVRALLRRGSVAGSTTSLHVGDLVLDPAARRVTRAGEPIELSKTEFDLLELLMANAGVVLTRDTIYERIWGYDFETGSRSLDVYVGYLRRKTEIGDRPRLVHTVRGVGYVLRP
jgi:two-component system response regulator MprA